MLVWYIGECMVSIININNDIKVPTCGIKILIPVKGERIFVYLNCYLDLTF